MTLAALTAALDGYVQAHAATADAPDAPSDDEFLAALADEMEAGRA